MAITLMVQVANSGNFHPGNILSNINQKVNTENIIIGILICLFGSSNYHKIILSIFKSVSDAPKNAKRFLVPRETV